MSTKVAARTIAENTPLTLFLPAFVVMAILYLVSETFPCLPGVPIGLALVSGVVLITAFFMSKAASRWLPFILILVGTISLWRSPLPVSQWVYGLSYLANVVVLVFLSPVIQLFFERRQYSPALTKVMSVNTDYRMSVLSTIFSHFLGAVVLFGSFFMVYEMMLSRKPVMGDRKFDDLISRGMIQGYGLIVIWSPVSASLAVGLAMAHLQWGDIVHLAAILAVGSMFISFVEQRLYVLTHYRTRSTTRCQDTEPPLKPSGGDVKKIIELAIVLVTFLATVVMLEEITHLSVMTVVPLVAILATVVGFTLTGEGGVGGELWNFFATRLPRKTADIELFMAAGFAGYGLRHVGIVQAVFDSIYQVASGDTGILLLALPLTIALVSCLGIPPLPVAALIAASVDPTTLPIPPSLLVFGLASGVSLGMMLSPISGPVLVASGLTGRNPLAVGLRSNWLFAVLFFAYLQVVLRFYL